MVKPEVKEQIYTQYRHIPSPSHRSFDNYACMSCQILPVVMARTAESRGAAELVGWKDHPVRCL